MNAHVRKLNHLLTDTIFNVTFHHDHGSTIMSECTLRFDRDFLIFENFNSQLVLNRGSVRFTSDIDEKNNITTVKLDGLNYILISIKRQ